MRKLFSLILALQLSAFMGSCSPPEPAQIITGPSRENPGKEVIPEPGVSYAKEILNLSATARDHYQIYQVNLKLYGNGGAFGKVQSRLDRIKALGTDILYLMPVYPEGKEKAIGSPYCIRDFKGVNSSYGTLEELKALVDAAHEKGMKVMFDWVANHTAWDHPWINEHPEWYEHKADGSIACPTKDGTWADVAQLDYAQSGLWSAMEDALEYWVKELGIDGYRCDYAHGVRDDFWKEAISKLRALKPGFLMLAESDFERMFDNGFDIIFDRAMKRRVITLFGGGAFSSFATWYKEDQGKTPAPKTKLFFVTNHDDATADTPSGQFKSLNGALAAYVLMSSLNGSAMLYGCQEAGNNKTINFFNTQSFNWDTNPQMTAKYEAALKALEGFSRKGGMKLYESGRVLFILYSSSAADGGTLIGVNVSGSTVKADFPQPVSGKGAVPTSKSFSPYEFQFWNL